MNHIECAWLTLNRRCNLRCAWCYAKGRNFAAGQNMNFALYQQLIDFLQKLEVKEIALIGGEPTCYGNLADLLRYAGQKDFCLWLITNGLMFADMAYLNELIHAGIGGINFSLKGWSKRSYIDNTGMDVFEDVIRALMNVYDSGVKYKVSFVISDTNIAHLLEAVELAIDCGAKEFYFSIEHDFSPLDGKRSGYDSDKIAKVINGFSEHCAKLDMITNGNFVLHQSLPLCLWDKNVIKQLTDKKQIYTSCSLLRRSGLVFDTDGTLLPCNAIHQLPLGKFGRDFCDRDSFNAFWNSEKITSIYNAFRKLPSLHCNQCGEALKCGGGCISNWYHFSYEDLLESRLIKME